LLIGIGSLLTISCGLVGPGGSDGEETCCPGGYTPVVIDSVVVWGPDEGPVVVDQDIFVSPEGTLRILAGTQVVYASDSICYDSPGGPIWIDPIIEVHGAMSCEGTSSAPVVFSGESGSEPCRVVVVQVYGSPSSRFDWTYLDRLEWWYGNPVHIENSTATQILLWHCPFIVLNDSRIGRTVVSGGGAGELRGNTFTGPLVVRADELMIAQNMFLDVDDPSWGAISTQQGSRSHIEENTFEECDIGVTVFAASPTIQRNNFADNTWNLTVIPEPLPLAADTVDARHNWWGTTDTTEIRQLIHYTSPDGYCSGKSVMFTPFAVEPISLTGGGRAAGLHPD
jgi:hypothetical protein